MSAAMSVCRTHVRSVSRRRRYTKDLLADAAAHATSCSDVLRYLGVPLRSGSYSHIAKKIKEFGIDTSHFTRQRRKYTAELLGEAAAQSDSVAGVLRRLGGLSEVGGTHAHISRMLKALEIDTSHFRRDQAPGAWGTGWRRRTSLSTTLRRPGVALRIACGERSSRLAARTPVRVVVATDSGKGCR